MAIDKRQTIIASELWE